MTCWRILRMMKLKITSCGTCNRTTEEENDKTNPFETIVDTYFFDRIMEIKNPLRENFLNECAVTPVQRQRIMEWFSTRFKVLSQFEFLPEVLHLTVAIFDRYLQIRKEIEERNLELIAVACIFIAVKMEHGLISKVKAEDGIFLTENRYSGSEIIEMEKEILLTLKFEVIIPSSYHFLCRCHLITESSELETFACMYLLEIALFSYETCHIRQSLQAASAYFIMKVLATEERDVGKLWTGAMEYYTGYALFDILPAVQKLALELYKTTIEGMDSKVFYKYNDVKYLAVSSMISNSKPLIRKLITCDEV